MSDSMHPGNGVLVTAVPHPFKIGNTLVEMAEGLTIAEMVERAQPDPMLSEYAVACINGHMIHAKYWHQVRPKAGTHVEIRVMPMGGGGGGKNILRIVLVIAVVAASLYFGPQLGAALFGQGAVIGGITAAQLGTAIIGLAGILAVNVIAPVKPPSVSGLGGSVTDERESPTYSIEGARNAARPFSPVPQILGRHKMVPPLGAAPYTEIVGNKQFLRMIFVWGIGPLHIDTSTLKIGDTPVSNFIGVEMEHKAGYVTDTPFTLYPDQVQEDSFAILLSSASGFITRTSGNNGDELSVDVTFAQGLVKFNNKGDRTNQSVQIEIQYRKVGDVTWLTPAFTAKTVPDTWVEDSFITFTHKKSATIRHGFTWRVAARGQYEVRIRRVTADTTDTSILDELSWVILRTITDEDPIQSDVPVAATAIRIQATEQLNRVIDEFSGVVTTLGKEWNGSSWIDDQQITNPAALYRHVCQGAANAVPMADSRLDLTVLEAWHEFNTLNNFHFNMVRDFQSSVWETLIDVSAAGRAAPTNIDGKWSVVIEEEKLIPVSHVTPRNSFDFRMEKAFPDIPDAWRISFNNEDEDWGLDERRVYRDGFTAETANKYESMSFRGVTDPSQIYHLGRFRIAQGLQQTERWSFKQDLEYITYKRGDRVKVTHDVVLIGLASGRVKSVTVDGSNNVTALTLDEKVPMEAGKSYNIAIRTIRGGEVTTAVDTDPGEQTTITLTTPIPHTGGLATVQRYDIFGFGEAGLETDDASILAVIPESNFSAAQIISVPYRPTIFDADTELAPPHVTNISTLPAIPAPVVLSVVTDESAIIRGPGNYLLTRMRIEVAPLNDPRLDVSRIEVERRPSETGEPFYPAEETVQETNYISIGDVNEGELWDVRLRFVISGRTPGPWTESDNHLIIGKSSPPSDVQNVSIELTQTGLRISWDEVTDIDLRHYEIRQGTVWETATHLAYVDSTEWVGFVQGTGTLTFMVKSIDTSENESANAGSDAISIGNSVASSLTAQVIDNNVLLRWNATAPGWPIDYFSVLRGDLANPGINFAEEIGIADVTFHNLQELVSGDKTYYIQPVDIAGNEGTYVSITVAVDAPPDFVLRSSFSTDFLGTSRDDMIRLPDPLDIDASAKYGGAKARRSAFFDGVDDYAQLDDTILNGVTDCTFEIDVRPEDSTHDHAVVSAANSTEDDEFTIVITDIDAIDVFVKGVSNSFTGISVDLFDGMVHKISLTRVSTTGSVQLYVDAVSAGTASLGTGALVVDANGFIIGQEQDSVGAGFDIAQAFEGYISEARLWNDVRTGTEISDLLDLRIEGDEAGLLANWRFYVGEGVVVEDVKDNDGVLVGAIWNTPLTDMLIPFPATETVGDRNTVHGYTSPQAQVTAGFPYVAQPVPSDPDTATFQESYDMGAVVNATRIVVTPTFEEIASGLTRTIQIEYRQTLGDSWTAAPVGGEALANDFRFVRVTITVESTDGHGFAKYVSLDTVARVKLKNDAGEVNVTANPTTVNFNESFIDVIAVSGTPQGTTARLVVIDFDDVASPTDFDVYLFDSSGSPATGIVRWQARGF